MLSGGDDGLGGGLICPDKDRCTNYTRQYNPEDSSEHHTRRRENLKSHIFGCGSQSVEVRADARALPTAKKTAAPYATLSYSNNNKQAYSVVNLLLILTPALASTRTQE
jgi:hypothetical protein